MGADRPGDADMPPDDHPDRRDDHDGTGDHAGRGGNDPAETRTRQEYYSELRVTVSREESAVARQTMAEERAAAEEWQERATESRWIWSEYQRKWPPAERPVGRQIEGSGGLLARGPQAGAWTRREQPGRSRVRPHRQTRGRKDLTRDALRRKPRSGPPPHRLRAPPQRPRPHQGEGLRHDRGVAASLPRRGRVTCVRHDPIHLSVPGGSLHSRCLDGHRTPERRGLQAAQTQEFLVR